MQSPRDSYLHVGELDVSGCVVLLNCLVYMGSTHPFIFLQHYHLLSTPSYTMSFSIAAVTLLLSHLSLGSPIGDKSGSSNSTLKWAPCDLGFPSTHQAVIDAHRVPIYCTTLKVPLDYSNPKNGRTLDLNLVKVEATKEPFKGSMIMNPGGPGASGVEEISKFGPMYADVFGGHFNVIGFDAR